MPLFPLLLLACPGLQPGWDADQDGDGALSWEDCDDRDAGRSPLLEERCDGLDNDCDQVVDEGYDADGDGWRTCDGDCADDDPAANPAGGPELCNGVDDDCDGQVDPEGCLYLDQADAVLVGEVAGDRAGCGVAGVGDLDGDGLDEVLVGAPGDAGGGDRAGAAYLVSGAALTGEVQLSDPALRLKLQATDRADEAGYAVRGAGDVDGDGLPDVLIGGPFGAATAGLIWLVSGASLAGASGVLLLDIATARLEGAAPGDYAGVGLGAGDVNGDGYSDLIVGAYGGLSDQSAGAAYIIPGPVSGALVLSEIAGALAGEVPGDGAGWSVASAGDTDGDGLDDVLVGAPGRDGRGALSGGAYLVLGPADVGSLALADARWTGDDQGDYAGFAVSGGGDIDGDGLSDVLVGAYQQSEQLSNAGAVYVLTAPAQLGGPLSQRASARLLGEANYDFAGASVSGAGDVDGDGHGDFLVGATNEASGGGAAGAAYLVYGGGLAGVLGLEVADKFIGTGEGRRTGWSVAGDLDTDGDPIPDLLIGSCDSGVGPSGPGYAYLIARAGL